MVDLSRLNPQQFDAVTQIHGPLLILAGAGTGKTQVLTFRIAHMVEQGIDPSNILAVTFTNKAAKEMKERISTLCGKTKGSKVTIGTFHSACIGILRKFTAEAGLRKGFMIIDTHDQVELLRKAINENDWANVYDPKKLQYIISQAKNQLLSPEDIQANKNKNIVDSEAIYRIYRDYQRLLKINNVVDFDDCIFKVFTLLNENEDVKAQVQDQFKYLLVDEFQDTNLAQLRLLELIAESHHNICVVGDDDQSIYSWRGALYETLEEFEKNFPETKLIKLEQNYRCAGNILNAANAVIKNNSKRKDKSLWSQLETNAPIVLSANENEAAEARYIAEQCLTLLGKGYQPSQIGIIYRANNQARHVELALRECNIRYKTFGGQSLFDKREVKDFFCYLRLCLNVYDNIAFWRIINTPHRGIGLKSIEKIASLASDNNTSPFQVLRQNIFKGTPKAQEQIDYFVNKISEFNSRPKDMAEHIQTLAEDIIKDFKLIDYIKTHVPESKARQIKLDNLRGLPDLIYEMCREIEKTSGKLDMRQLLDGLTLNELQSDDEDDKGNYVSLMTIHAAKGLEFPAVFICGLEDDLLPHKNSIETKEGLAEERRLFYVAITRAKQRLYMTYCHYRSTAKQKIIRTPSRFIKELPKGENLERKGLFGSPEEIKTERKTAFASRLSSLRASLDK